jgi:hypothetical protein
MNELMMISDKLALADSRQMAFAAEGTYAANNILAHGEAAVAAPAWLEQRQQLLEMDEANSVMELEMLLEKLRLEATRESLFSFDEQLSSLQGTVNEAAEAVRQTLTSGEEYARSLPGALPLVGYFDPLGILSGSTEEKAQYYRDAELKHGRIGTLAAFGILVSEAYHPFGGEEMNGVPAVLAFQHNNLLFQTAVVASMAALASRPQLVPATARKQTTEIWHVRGGMLAAFAMIADEALTKTCLVCI